VEELNELERIARAVFVQGVKDMLSEGEFQAGKVRRWIVQGGQLGATDAPITSLADVFAVPKQYLWRLAHELWALRPNPAGVDPDRIVDGFLAGIREVNGGP
jgi:hypothetical protein